MSLIVRAFERVASLVPFRKANSYPLPMGEVIYENPSPPILWKFWNIGFHGTDRSTLIDQAAQGKLKDRGQAIYFSQNPHYAATFGDQWGIQEPVLLLVGTNGKTAINWAFWERHFPQGTEVVILKAWKISEQWLLARQGQSPQK